MKYCKKCGKELVDDAVVCIQCGCAVNSVPNANVEDAPNMGLAVLGFFIPLAGLILYLINKDTTPLKAKSAGKGALIGFCVNFIVSLIYGFIIGFAAAFI